MVKSGFVMMNPVMSFRLRLAAAALALIAVPASADTPFVTLKLDATPIAITGHLVATTGTTYVVDSRFGTVEVAKRVAVCHGCSDDLVVADVK